MDEAALFEQMELARGIATEDAIPEEDDGHDATTRGDCPPVVVSMPNGRIHVCRGFECPHAMQSNEVDRAFTCALSGRMIGSTMEAAHDSSWTGRSCGSADPDMNSGAACTAWRNKRNAFAASAAAYTKAATIDVGDVVAFDDKPVDAKPIKRGAPCVVDVDEGAVNNQKRNKALKRVASLKNRDVQTRLFADASAVVVKLYSVLTGPRSAKKTEATTSVAPATSTMNDPRLENFDFVLKMALQRYVARCKHVGNLPTLSGIHDVAASANTFVKERQRGAKTQTDVLKARQICTNVQVIEICARLIFSMWTALCSTPFFTHNQTGDSFRPFAAGVMFGLKRGIRLGNNTVLVPSIESLSSPLPELRSATATPAARQLQAASHKGLCSLHRGLASIDSMNPDAKREIIAQLQVVAAIAKRLDAFVHTLKSRKT